MRARKRFGQHFLEPAWQTKVIAACQVAPTDAVVEIGPGRGALTLPLVERAAHVLAVEVDRDLAAALEARALPTLQVVTGDFLRPGLGRADGRRGADRCPDRSGSWATCPTTSRRRFFSACSRLPRPTPTSATPR